MFRYISWVVLFFIQALINDSQSQNIHKNKIDGLSTVTKSSSFLKPRNAATAKIYDGDAKKKGRAFHLTNEADYWFDLNQVMNDGKIERIDKLCVQGTWLVYDEPDFQTDSKQAVGIVSGEKVCVSLKKYGSVSSIQPITPLISRKSDTLAFFPDRDFSGKVWPVDRNVGEGQMGRSPKVRSLITMGKQEWTIIPAEGKPICISPQSNFKFPVCFVSKLVDGMKVKTGKFLSIRKGCVGIEKNKKIAIHFCMAYESGKIQRIEAIAQRMQGRAVGAAAKDKEIEKDEGCPVGSDEHQIDAEGQALMKIRLTTDLQSDTILKWPSNVADVWKIELLERAFDVAMQTCPHEIVPIQYFKLVREVFVFLLDKSWKGKKGNSSGQVGDEEWRVLNSQLTACSEILEQKDGTDVVTMAMDRFMSVRSPSAMNSSMDEMLKFRENYDQVIETVWLVANNVAATCHHTLGYVSDFWTNFIDVFQKMYFNSVEKQWSEPGKWNNAYKFVLGGYGIENTYNKIGICTTIAINAIDNLDPFSRNVDVDSKLK